LEEEASVLIKGGGIGLIAAWITLRKVCNAKTIQGKKEGKKRKQVRKREFSGGMRNYSGKKALPSHQADAGKAKNRLHRVRGEKGGTTKLKRPITIGPQIQVVQIEAAIQKEGHRTKKLQLFNIDGVNWKKNKKKT